MRDVDAIRVRDLLGGIADALRRLRELAPGLMCFKFNKRYFSAAVSSRGSRSWLKTQHRSI